MTPAALFLLLVLSVGCTSAKISQKQLHSALNTSVSPCDSFFTHTCNFNSEIIKQFSASHGKHLLEDLAGLLPPLEDPVMLRMVAAMKKYFAASEEERLACRSLGLTVVGKDEEKFAFGRLMGQRTASGKKSPFRFYCTSRYRCWLDSDLRMDSEWVQRGSGITEGFLKGYFSALDIHLSGGGSGPVVKSRNFDWQKLQKYKEEIPTEWEQLTAFSHDLVSPNLDSFAFHSTIAMVPSVRSYFNLLYARTMYKHPEVFHPELTVDFEKLAMRIVDEVVEAIESADWLRDSTRTRLARRIRGLNIHVGIPKQLRNLTLLEHRLKYFRKEVASVPTDGVCELEMIGRKIAQARNIHTKIRNEVGTVDVNSWQKPYDDSLFIEDGELQQSGEHIFIHPPTLHFLHGDFSVGFKYGFTGLTIAQEIFHRLGLTDRNEKSYLKRVVNTEHFKDAQDCYRDYYGSFCHNDECPNGDRKKEEGFSDVEGARVLYRVIRKAINQASYSTRAKRESSEEEFPLFGSTPMSSWNANEDQLLSDHPAVISPDEVKWFFYGMQFGYCKEGSNDEHKIISDILFHKQPRDSIRIDAVLRQMPEFSEAFQCKEGDPNYVIPEDERCYAYPLLKKVQKTRRLRRSSRFV